MEVMGLLLLSSQVGHKTFQIKVGKIKNQTEPVEHPTLGGFGSNRKFHSVLGVGMIGQLCLDTGLALTQVENSLDRIFQKLSKQATTIATGLGSDKFFDTARKTILCKKVIASKNPTWRDELVDTKFEFIGQNMLPLQILLCQLMLLAKEDQQQLRVGLNAEATASFFIKVAVLASVRAHFDPRASQSKTENHHVKNKREALAWLILYVTNLLDASCSIPSAGCAAKKQKL